MPRDTLRLIFLLLTSPDLKTVQMGPTGTSIQLPFFNIMIIIIITFQYFLKHQLGARFWDRREDTCRE